MLKHKRYGWKRDLPDHRDMLYDAPQLKPEMLPNVVDLEAFCPPVYDQGELGSCTANAIAAACEFAWRKQHKPSPFTPSRLAIYYDERSLEDTVSSDSGAMLRDGMKVVHSVGFAPETLWPYDLSAFDSEPPKAYYEAAASEKITSYGRVPQNLAFIKTLLYAQIPIVIGFTVYESFETNAVAKSGEVPMPRQSESVLGGHAVLIVGYSDNTRRFMVRNSWGANWGLGGYFTMPYQYFLDPNLASDLWAVRFVP